MEREAQQKRHDRTASDCAEIRVTVADIDELGRLERHGVVIQVKKSGLVVATDERDRVFVVAQKVHDIVALHNHKPSDYGVFR